MAGQIMRNREGPAILAGPFIVTEALDAPA